VGDSGGVGGVSQQFLLTLALSKCKDVIRKLLFNGTQQKCMLARVGEVTNM
jgi:hypothetical protein